MFPYCRFICSLFYPFINWLFGLLHCCKVLTMFPHVLPKVTIVQMLYKYCRFCTTLRIFGTFLHKPALLVSASLCTFHNNIAHILFDYSENFVIVYCIYFFGIFRFHVNNVLCLNVNCFNCLVVVLTLYLLACTNYIKANTSNV